MRIYPQKYPQNFLAYGMVLHEKYDKFINDFELIILLTQHIGAIFKERDTEPL